MFCEIDKYAATSYCAVHGVNPSINLGDITKADEKSVPDFNVMVGGSPCFVAGTPIITASGYKNIEDVSLRDLVLTHTGSFKRIKRIGSDDNKHIWRVCAQGILPIRCTENHPFLILKKGSAEPEWVQASQINKGDCIAVPIPRPSDCINDAEITKEEAWILGRYIADGYISKNQIVLCIGKDKLSDLDNLVGIPYRLTRKSESCTGCHIKSDRLLGIIRQFGMDKYSYEKEIPPQLLFGNEDILRRVLDGYFSGDGCRIKDAIQATTTSKKLAMSICLAIQKVYGVGPKIYFEKRPETYKIDGRIISQRDTYMVRALLQKTGKEHYVEDAERGYYWYPVRSVSDEESFERVYNMEVLDDNSYVAGNAVVHNCQDFSIAGKQGGAMWRCSDCGHEYNPLEAHYTKRDRCPKCGSKEIEKTRSSLIVEWLRFLYEKKPRFAIYENVKNLVGAKFLQTFDMFVRELEDYGYNVYWQVIDAKNQGIPQHRERVYCVIIRNDLDNGLFRFPDSIPLKRTLMDLCERNVHERYYLPDNKVTQMISPPQASYCITSTYHKGIPFEHFLKTHQRQLVMEYEPKYRVRKLTPLECWRLMGFEDDDFYRAQSAMNENLYGGKDRSGTQLYKQAGNSIVVDVLLHIFENLYDAMPYLFEDIQIGSFFSGIGAFEKALSMLLENGDRGVLSLEGKSDIIGVVDPQGRTNKKCRINEVCPTLRAQTHGNPPCVVHDQLEQVGYINDYNGDANRIYDCSVARALKAEAGGGGAKTGWYRFPQ